MAEVHAGILNRLRKGVKAFDSIIEKEPVVFLRPGGDAWINGPAGKIIAQRRIDGDDLIRRLRLEPEGLASFGIEAVVVRLKDGVTLAMLKEGAPLRPFNLTPREMEVLSLLIQGMSNKEIANQLKGISPGTVNTHLDSIYRKLGASGRLQAAYVAVKHGIVA